MPPGTSSSIEIETFSFPACAVVGSGERGTERIVLRECSVRLPISLIESRSTTFIALRGVSLKGVSIRAAPTSG